MGTIGHLGIQMYQTLPPVISELISNAYDADAEIVEINFEEFNGDKRITVKDNGCGMTFDEVNNKLLLIGRNRRHTKEDELSPKKKRKVTGRKGIGKLAVFGIAEEIHIKTIKDGLKNELKLCLPDIQECENSNIGNPVSVYEPTIIAIDTMVDTEPDGTTITLNNIKRHSPFDIDTIVYNITKRFSFNDEDFIIRFLYNDELREEINKDSKLKIFNGQFTWNFPEEKNNEMSYSHSEEITGKIITSEKPLEETDRGITLFARGKLVNKNEFYGIKITTSNAYNYMAGFLNVDFIDNSERDLINTSRDGLIWDNEELESLRMWIQSQLKSIEKEWRDKRIAERLKQYQEKHEGKDYKKWTENLPKHEKKLATSIIDTIILNEKIPEEVMETLLQYVENSFQYTTFKEFASELDNLELDSPDIASKLLQLFKDWEAIESKEFYRLCIGRIETIKTLEKLIDENAREVPEIHTFLKNYPWLMEPRIKDFNDEVTFTKLLKDEFKENSSIPEADKRIDFYCKSFDNNIYIYELKRPNITAKEKELNQLVKYKSFVSKNIGNDSYQNIYCYLLCKGISTNSEGANILAEGLKSQSIYVRTYSEILGQAYNYHKEFIDKYDELKAGSVND